ncbi:MAG: D-alanyl-D-alanine carboxypeptidase/D-alanyl-D-alanine-endopeptidase [Bdellovibrionales bacterium]
MLSIFLSIIISVSASANAKNTNISERLKKVMARSGLSQQDLGLFIQSSPEDEIFNINAKQNFVPASISKIPTALAALETWGPGHRFSTQVYMDGSLVNGTLSGNLILKGQGEPALVSERMWFLVNALTRFQIQKVTGDIIVDESYFDSIRYDKDRLPMSEGRAFDAPVSALSFNWNAANIFIRPTRAGQAAEVFVDPANSYIIGVANQTKTISSGNLTVNATPTPVKQGDQIIGDKIFSRGQIPVGQKEVVLYRSISEPDLWAGANFKEFLKQRQIHVVGQVKRGRAGSGAQLLIDEPGSAVREVVTDMMKFSNNFIAEMLAKHLSVESGSRPGNLPAGVEMIKKSMDRVGLDRKDYSYVSPSGLTVKNKMSASQFNRILYYAIKSSVAPEFLSSLPLAGIDGTLKSRLKGYNVRAKTGLLSGVSSLAGFAYKKDGTVFTFSFMYNGSKHFIAKDLFEDLIIELLK